MFHSPAFPAKAGTQTLSLRRKTARWLPAFVGAVEIVEEDPLTQPSPPEGGEGFIVLALSLWERVG